MVNATITRILQLSGSVPDATRYRRHLEGLKPQALVDRLHDLETDALKDHAAYTRQRGHQPKPKRIDLFHPHG